ncbi:uncharacterized protein [Coffea arabica]|uniref:Uncharacterized protein n=1 Tax=Coffea arabica TaxID=13443 RepID=A0ABM4VBX7_COFAR
MIHRIKAANGVWVESDADIAREAIAYFSDLFSGTSVPSSDMLHLIPPVISGEDNKLLEAAPTIEEVHRVVKEMDGDSAAGPDGFTGKFFTFASEVIAQDVHAAVLSFFCGAELPRFITSTSLVLIPKVSSPQDFSQFRLISLCNFFNKLLSRILADRLAGILPKLISPQQTDDVLIFANGSASSLKDIMQVLEGYQRCSGQLINAQKSGYLTHSSLAPARRRVIERVTGFVLQVFPIRYLGFPLYVGRCKSSYFGEVAQAILQRIMSWKSKLLSSGGKIVLIKHVLSAIPVHLLSAAVLPRLVFDILEKACSNFLWGSSPDKTKFHWIRWSQLCFQVEEGGVGFRRLEDVYTAFSCKLWWSFRTGVSVWVAFLRAKYRLLLRPGDGW